MSRRWLYLAAVLAPLGVAAIACDTTPGSAPAAGDNVIDDTHPTATPTTTTPPPPPDDAGASDAYAYDVYSHPVPDGYAPVALCATCGCSTADGGTYCFGGATGNYGGTCHQSDGSTLEVGCMPIPAECAAKPTCDCILKSLPSFPCYPVCANKGGEFTVYCPNP